MKAEGEIIAPESPDGLEDQENKAPAGAFFD